MTAIQVFGRCAGKGCWSASVKTRSSSPLLQEEPIGVERLVQLATH
jgi:hypothetical protein